jgi:hypothetical protein
VSGPFVLYLCRHQHLTCNIPDPSVFHPGVTRDPEPAACIFICQPISGTVPEDKGRNCQTRVPPLIDLQDSQNLCPTSCSGIISLYLKRFEWLRTGSCKWMVTIDSRCPLSMSFGWSFGDVVAGINLIFKIYDAVSDGPRNSKVEATQFFADFGEVIARLDKWGSSKAACDKDQTLKASHEELKLLCTTFIKRHFRIIQGANPNTKTSRPGRSTWLKRVSFTASQVASLYTQVQWPLERKELSRLREKLQFFLQLSAWDVAIDTNQIVSEFK